MSPPYPTSSAAELDATIRAVCPQIDGVSVDGTIFFQPSASPAGRAAAQAAMQNFVPTDPAIERARRQSLKDDAQRAAMLNRLKTSTAAQIDNYVQNNVTNLAQAQAAIGMILKLIALDARNGT